MKTDEDLNTGGAEVVPQREHATEVMTGRFADIDVGGEKKFRLKDDFIVTESRGKRMVMAEKRRSRA